MNSGGLLRLRYVVECGPFLKVWAQIDRNNVLFVEKSLNQLAPHFDQDLTLKPSIDTIHLGMICGAKYKDNVYYRVQILNTSLLNQNLVEVHFIDYGNNDVVNATSLRLLSSVAPNLVMIPPQAQDFILANVTYPGNVWNPQTLKLINNDLSLTDLQYFIVGQNSGSTFIKIYQNGEDVMMKYFNLGMLLSIATNIQFLILQNSGSTLNMSAQQMEIPPLTSFVPPITQAGPTLATYKAMSLEPNVDHQVYVSYVSDGPCQFYVQLQSFETNLARLMNDLNRMTLEPLDEDPLPGTVCVARCLVDDHICRAVVTNMVDGKYKVFFVDFGNTESISIDNIYKIPFKYLLPRVLAIRYSLASIENINITRDMKCAFKDFVSDKLLQMRSYPPRGRTAISQCDLWDSENKNVLDILRQAALLSYSNVPQLTRGSSHNVCVSYVKGCNKFYVQLHSNHKDLSNLMQRLQIECSNSEKYLSVDKLKAGLPCNALFQEDQQWYRAQIVSILPDNLTVKYVDYGNEEFVSIDCIKEPIYELLTCLKPQAIECCLNGYQNMPEEPNRDIILESLILEKDCNIKVVELIGSKVLVDVTDQKGDNIGSKLLEGMLKKQKSQSSPPSKTIDSWSPDSPERKSRRRSDDRTMGGDIQPYGNERKESFSKTSEYNSNRNNIDRDNSRKPNFNREDRRDREHNHRKEYTSNSRKEYSPRSPSSRGSTPTSRNWQRRGTNEKYRGNNDRKRSNDDRNNYQRNENAKSSYNDRRASSPYSNKFDNYKSSKATGGFKDTNEKEYFSNSKPSHNTRRAYSPASSDKFDNYKSKSSKETNENDNFSNTKSSYNARSANSSSSKKFDNKSSKSSDGFKSLSDPVPFTTPFNLPELSNPFTAAICWFHNPAHFYCQLIDTQIDFENMMHNIQEAYRDIRPERNVPVGSSIIARFPEDDVLYRARILSVHGSQYRVQYIDFGNVSNTEKVWAIEKKFMDMPVQAIRCSLNRLLPCDNEWPEADAFASYFNNDTYICQIIDTENEELKVELSYDDVLVSQKLLEANLARYEDVRPTVDLSLLFEQQLRVTLLEVESLESIVVQFDDINVIVCCQVHNLGTAETINEQILRDYVNSGVIIYVDNVTESKLEVTFYDLSGFKIQIVEPDEGAFDSVEPICSFPVYFHYIYGTCVYYQKFAVDSYQLCIQFEEHTSIINQLLESLYSFYNDSTVEGPIIPEINRIYAVLSSDGDWYRGEVVEIFDSDTPKEVSVLFIDYGNAETVNIQNLRELDDQFKVYYMLCLKVTTTIPVDEEIIKKSIEGEVYFGNNGWEIILHTIDGVPVETGPMPVEIDSVPINAFSNSIEQPSSDLPNEMGETIPQSSINDEAILEKGNSVIVSHFDTPNEFYLQFSNEINKIENLLEDIQERVTEWPNLENPTAGILCAAPFSVDEQWYRAQILDADADITTVRFVDYGNTDVIDNSATLLKTLPPELLAIEQYAKCYSLLVKPIEEEWSQAACQVFEKLTKSTNLFVEVINENEKSAYVKLYADDCDVAEELLKEKLCESLTVEVCTTGYLSHLNSPSEFWIQYENAVADLELVADQLANADKFPELEDMTPGSLCVALFPEDEMWYRARILSNTIAGIEVLFIDYGNSCLCCGLKQLPEDLIMLPSLAQKCSLQKPSGILQWSDEAVEEFKILSADGATIFNINKISTGETSIVKLILDGKDIVSRLLPITQNCYISNFESVSDFSIHLDSSPAKLDWIGEKLSSAAEFLKYEDNKVNDIVVAQFLEDLEWYRAQILNIEGSEYEVLFIDFGNKSTVTDVRIASSEIKEEPPLSIQCKIEPLPGYCWANEASETLSEISNGGNTLFQVEFTNTNVVRLYLSGSDVRMLLKSETLSSAHNTPKKVTKQVDEAFVETHGELNAIASLSIDEATEGIDITTAQHDVSNISSTHDPSHEAVSEMIVDFVDMETSDKDQLNQNLVDNDTVVSERIQEDQPIIDGNDEEQEFSCIKDDSYADEHSTEIAADDISLTVIKHANSNDVSEFETNNDISDEQDKIVGNSSIDDSSELVLAEVVSDLDIKTLEQDITSGDDLSTNTNDVSKEIICGTEEYSIDRKVEVVNDLDIEVLEQDKSDEGLNTNVGACEEIVCETDEDSIDPKVEVTDLDIEFVEQDRPVQDLCTNDSCEGIVCETKADLINPKIEVVNDFDTEVVEQDRSAEGLNTNDINEETVGETKENSIDPKVEVVNDLDSVVLEQDESYKGESEGIVCDVKEDLIIPKVEGLTDLDIEVSNQNQSSGDGLSTNDGREEIICEAQKDSIDPKVNLDKSSGDCVKTNDPCQGKPDSIDVKVLKQVEDLTIVDASEEPTVCEIKQDSAKIENKSVSDTIATVNETHNIGDGVEEDCIDIELSKHHDISIPNNSISNIDESVSSLADSEGISNINATKKTNVEERLRRPYSERIVPGSISRGDLSDVDAE